MCRAERRTVQLREGRAAHLHSQCVWRLNRPVCEYLAHHAHDGRIWGEGEVRNVQFVADAQHGGHHAGGQVDLLQRVVLSTDEGDGGHAASRLSKYMLYTSPPLVPFRMPTLMPA